MSPPYPTDTPETAPAPAPVQPTPTPTSSSAYTFSAQRLTTNSRATTSSSCGSSRVPSPFRSKSPATTESAGESSSSKPPAMLPPNRRTPSSWHRRHPTTLDWARLRTAAEDTPAFDRSLASVLGSPYLTTSALPLPSPDVDLVDGAFAAVPHTDTVTRPPSPAPTADYSIVSIPSVASQLLAARASRPRLGLGTPSRATLAAYLSAGVPSPSTSTRKRSRAPSPRGSARGLIPRLFGSLGAPHKRGKHKSIPAFAPDVDTPLDGEEGELVDEACFFVDLGPPSPTPEPEEPASADPFGALPPELALRVLALLDARALARCAAVCHAWRALTLDNLLWAALFAARASDGWAVDPTRLARPESRRRPPAMDRRGSERSLASTLARARKNSTRSLMSWRAGKTPALAVTAEEAAPSPAALALDWRRLYESRQLLDRRWASAEPAVSKISGHSDSVYCLEFDSQRIVTGSRDRTIKVWALATGELLGSFRGHNGSVLCLKFERDWDAADARAPGFMVSGSSDCSILVWNLWAAADGEVHADVRAVLRGHTGGVLDLRMDERSVVSCSKDALIQVWDRETLALRCTLRGHEGPVNAVGLQGARVVSASGDGKMILWDVASGARLRTFEGHDRGLACIEFKAGLIVSGSNDCKIKVWDAQSGACVRTLVGHTALVRALAFDPVAGRLVSAGYDRTVKVWDLARGTLVREFRGEHASHIFDVRFDVRRIVSTSHDQKIAVFDFGEGLPHTELFV